MKCDVGALRSYLLARCDAAQDAAKRLVEPDTWLEEERVLGWEGWSVMRGDRKASAAKTGGPFMRTKPRAPRSLLAVDD